MRLERVIAKDSRRATEQVIATYGPDALIVSNQRVNGMTEIVVAVDTEQDNVALEGSEGEQPGGSIDLSPAPKTAFNRSLQASLRGLPEDDEDQPDGSAASESHPIPPFLRAEKTPPEASEQGFDSPPLRAARALPRDPAPIGSGPAPDHVHVNTQAGGHAKPVAAPNVRSINRPEGPSPRRTEASMQDAEPVTFDEAAATDALRARELVDLVRAELASMRKEIALSRQVETFQPGGALPVTLQPLAGALITAGVPVGLRALLLDQVRDIEDGSHAVEAMKQHLCATIRELDTAERLSGIHVLAGPSGAGKTQMICRLAARHAAAHGCVSVAMISFADNRIGAWTQFQMLAARMGVDCFRVTDPNLMGPMLSELDTRKLILIDTPSAGFAERLATLKTAAIGAHFHLVMPADASASSIGRFIPGPDLTWQSVMVSKLDESTQPWALIQALCNHPVPLSVASADAAPDSAAAPLAAHRLVDLAFEHLELPTKSQARARKPRTPVRKAVRELRHAA